VPTIFGTAPTNDCQLADPKSQNKLPKDIKGIEKPKKERKRLRRAKSRALSDELHSEDQASNEDESDRRVASAASFLPEEFLLEDRASNADEFHGWVTRASPFLPEPPSFDAVIFRKNWM
jgi:hypothetical protein